MKRAIRFFFLELVTFIVMGLITLMEIVNFNFFETFFTLIKTPSSWFVGLSLAYAFSNFFQTNLFSFFSKRSKDETKEKGDFFTGFIITLILTSLITPYVKDIAGYFFSNFFIYFHIIVMQSVILLYLLFKLKNNYEISGKYFITNEVIILFYTAIIVSFVA